MSFTSNDGVFLAPYPQRHIWLSEKMDSAGANYIVTFKIPIKSEKEIDYKKIEGLRIEAMQKLDKIRPLSLGQASRISGVSPADIAVLMIYLKQ